MCSSQVSKEHERIKKKGNFLCIINIKQQQINIKHKV